MDRNFALALVLSFLVLMLWTMFTESNRPPPGSIPPGEELMQEPAAEATPEVTGETPFPSSVAATPVTPEAAPVVESFEEERVEIATPLYEAEFTTRGGTLVSWKLRDYRTAKEHGSLPVDLVTYDAETEPALSMPFDELGQGDLGQRPYRVEQPDALTLVFSRVHDGVVIRKTYRFDEERYVFRLHVEVENRSSRHIQARFKTRWPVEAREDRDFNDYSLVALQEGSLEQALVGSGQQLLGMFGGSGLKEPMEFATDVDWAGAQSRYFLAAMIADVPQDAGARFTPVVPGVQAVAEMAFKPVNIPPDQRAEREIKIFLGPKLPEHLEAVGAHLDEAIMKGWFPSLTRFFVWLLVATHDVIPNYGVAIILVTILVRLLMAPVMARQMKSMKKMGAMQPKMKEIQEKYADDRQKQSEAMMAAYREAGMSPFSAMAGCLPMLLQLPVFIGLYYALQGAIQLRQEPFVLWITDLSAPEALFTIPGLELPVRLLPLLMGGSMVLQQKMTPTTMDAAQARMMLTVMPIMFTLLFYQFASGLVLYWLVSNVLGIAQQALTNRSPATAK